MKYLYFISIVLTTHYIQSSFIIFKPPVSPTCKALEKLRYDAPDNEYAAIINALLKENSSVCDCINQISKYELYTIHKKAKTYYKLSPFWCLKINILTWLYNHFCSIPIKPTTLDSLPPYIQNGLHEMFGDTIPDISFTYTDKQSSYVVTTYKDSKVSYSLFLGITFKKYPGVLYHELQHIKDGSKITQRALKQTSLETVIINTNLLEHDMFFPQQISVAYEKRADRIPAACLSPQVAQDLEDLLSSHYFQGFIQKKSSTHPGSKERKEWAIKLRRLREWETKIS